MSAPARSLGSAIVVGGGISGLAAAWELTGGATPDAAAPRVCVLEASPTLGGPIKTTPIAGRPVDVGPDCFVGRVPDAYGLCSELGLTDALTPVGTSGASLYARGRLRPLPPGLVSGVPTRWLPVARSGLLGPAGSLRLLRDPVLSRPDRRGPLGDRALGPLVSRRLGAAVVTALVDPLMGGIHAGSVADMSTAAVAPLLLAQPRRGSLMRSLAKAERLAAQAREDRGAGPRFWALAGGMGTLIERLSQELSARGVQIVTGAKVEGLRRENPGWSVSSTAGERHAQGVVLALPASCAADLLEPHDPNAASLARSEERSSVALVTLAYDEPTELPEGTGFLVPRGATLASITEPMLLTACTFLDQKWPHLAVGGQRLLRASVGRSDDTRSEQLSDADLTRRVAGELGEILQIGSQPCVAAVTRWPEAFPQYKVGHLLRVNGIEAATGRLGGLAVAGSSYRGVGIPACIASGRRAARMISEAPPDA
ncbi:MAG: protoporphyrinogen oxidase [Acidimicrobiales bacterium]